MTINIKYFDCHGVGGLTHTSESGGEGKRSTLRELDYD